MSDDEDKEIYDHRIKLIKITQKIYLMIKCYYNNTSYFINIPSLQNNIL